MSQRVRLLNGHLILKELLLVAEDCAFHGVSYSNFVDVWDEFGRLCGSDVALQDALPYFKEFRAAINRATENKKERGLRPVLSLIQRAVNDCDKVYDKALVKRLVAEIVRNNIEETLSLCDSLFSDFASRGVSLETIEQAFDEHFSNGQNFYVQLDSFVKAMLAIGKSMQVSFLVNVGKENANSLDHLTTMVKSVKLQRSLEDLPTGEAEIGIFRFQFPDVVVATANVEATEPKDAVRLASQILNTEFGMCQAY